MTNTRALALSGTGANYIIHAGAVEGLLEAGMQIGEILGASGGAMMGALLASGKSPREVLELSKEFTPPDILRLNKLWFAKPGIFHLERLPKLMGKYVAKTMGETKIPYTATATDSDTGEAVYFTSKDTPDVPVASAVQASISMPDIFVTVKVNGRRLTDGGVTDNFPADRASMKAVGVRVLGAKSEMKPWKWWGSFNVNVISAMMQAIERQHISTALWNKAQILTIASPISGLDFFKLTPEKLNELYDVGLAAVRNKIKTGWTWK